MKKLISLIVFGLALLFGLTVENKISAASVEVVANSPPQKIEIDRSCKNSVKYLVPPESILISDTYKDSWNQDARKIVLPEQVNVSPTIVKRE